MPILGDFKIEHDMIDLQVNDRVSKVVPFAYEHTDGKEYLGLMYREANKIIETIQITASDAEATDLFGQSVALDGTRLVVGAHYEDTAATDAGKVYIYDWNGTAYDEVGTLTASDAQQGDVFGTAVALDGTRLAVGARAEDSAATNAGKVYIYEWNGASYVEVATLTASDAQTNDQFGAAVALDGTRLAVSAPNDDTAGNNTGKVYIYEWSGAAYNQVTALTASDAQDSDRFGDAVALDGTRLVVGAIGEDTAANEGGKVYIYDWNGTTYAEVGTITASDAQQDAQLGMSVALYGTRLVVGATGAVTAGTAGGKVYIYEWNGMSYVEVATLTASDAEADDSFGSSVSLDGTRLVVGAQGADTEAGKVYIYDIDEYSESFFSSTSSDHDGTLSEQDTKIIILDVELV